MATETVSRLADAGAPELVIQLRSLIDELERRLNPSVTTGASMALTATDQNSQSPRGRGRYYTPATTIRETEGVTKNISSVWQDSYVGTLDALVASGIATADMFPGQPGNGRSRTTYQVAGVLPPKGESVSNVAGYIEIHRTVAGDFRVHLTVTREERARREQLQREERETNEERRRQATAIVQNAQELARSMRQRDDIEQAPVVDLATLAGRPVRPTHLRLV
ncbi:MULTISPECIES: hypothetical protein [unclassified Rhizobacter]|uniref:hypothetical protein n=1 Tax=unclassified Rhizobacter TaxID=2640088 RepID=UPI0006F2B415|nr:MULTISPECIES: hypothetical protein [unclassified Rhizobacter]KQU78175.1 hypothetical protein ASC88_20355 [Rhizobacter sp. Root29]KQW15921.1 hypothetical protein ASC98_01575 [Rhizobacter sp. Root1238]KRB25039.1 hypothetical protein ASE08_02325 [Rhizobacter sp. Root16D2]